MSTLVDEIAALRQSTALFPNDGATYVFDCTEIALLDWHPLPADANRDGADDIIFSAPP